MAIPFLLGIIDDSLDGQQTDWSTNKIGGNPNWIVSANIPQCPGCSQGMTLIVQMYCPLGNSIYHRTLYLFTCVKCKDNRWKLIRQQKMDETAIKEEEKQQEVTHKSDEWGVEGDDWGTNADDWGSTEDDLGTSTDEWLSSSKLGDNNDNKNSENFNETNVSNTDPEFMSNSCFDLEKNSSNKQNLRSAEQSLYKTVNSEECMVTELSNMEISHVNDVSENDSLSSNIIVEDDMIDQTRADDLLSVLETSAQMDTYVPSDQCLKSYYINVVEEPEEQLTLEESRHIKQLLRDYEKSHGAVDDQQTSGGGGGSGEKYEKSSHSDKYYHKFLKRIGRSPEQIIRYEWGGCPLYISKPDSVLCGASQQLCPHCGGQLVFELQIMPALINSLRYDKMKDPAIEYGTVMVYTCKASCWTNGDICQQEHVYVQQDPDQQYFKTSSLNKIFKK